MASPARHLKAQSPAAVAGRTGGATPYASPPGSLSRQKLNETQMPALPDPAVGVGQSTSRTTEIEKCVQQELQRYFDLLDGENPANLYRMVIKQAENAVIDMVMLECRGNQTRASEWLGISRGNLRTKLANREK
jgi:Fis family transcriptional regulator